LRFKLEMSRDILEVPRRKLGLSQTKE